MGAKRIDYICSYCGKTVIKQLAHGRPEPGRCPRKTGDRPHSWRINRRLGGDNLVAILIYLFFIAIFLIVPLPAKLILLAINIFVPDPIPVLDEVIMEISVLKKINTLETVWELFDEHRYLIPVAVAAIIGLLILLYKLIF